LSEVEAFKKAGAKLASGEVNLGTPKTNNGRVEPSVPVPSGGEASVQPTVAPAGDTTGTGTPIGEELGTDTGVASGAGVGEKPKLSALAPDINITPIPKEKPSGTQTSQTIQTETQGQEQPPAAPIQGKNIADQIIARADALIARADALAEKRNAQGTAVNPELAMKAAPVETEATPVETEAAPIQGENVLENKIYQSYTKNIADQIIARANALVEEGNAQGTAVNPELAMKAAEAEITEVLPGGAAYEAAPVETEAAPVEAAPVTVPSDQVAGDTPASQIPATPETGLKPPGKRGRKPIVRTPEEQQAAAEQRKTRQQVGKASIVKAQKAQKVIDTPFSVENYDTLDAAKAAGAELQSLRNAALLDAYNILNDRNIAKEAAAKKIARNIVNHPSVDVRERTIAQNKSALTAKTSTPSTARAELLLDSTNPEPDITFEKFTRATQAIDHIIKTGNAFEKLLARLIRPFLKDVKIVIVRNPDTNIPTKFLRSKFTNALGMYAESKKHGKIIFLNADNRFNGLSNMTLLHEAVHGATMAQINAWTQDPLSVSPAVREALEDMKRIMERAYKYYAVLRFVKKTDATINQLGDAGAFEDLKEFVAYGLAQTEMQDFLQQVPGEYKVEKGVQNLGLLSRFTRSVRKIFNLGDEHASAFQDLVVVTDRILSASKPTEASEATITALAKKIAGPIKLQRKIAASQNPAVINATLGQLVMTTRNAKDALRLLRATYNALSVGRIRLILPTLTTEDITRWIGNKSANIPRINVAVQEMASMRSKMIRELAQKVPQWIEFGKNYEQGGRALGDVMHVSTLIRADPSAHTNLAAALQNDVEIKVLIAEYTAALQDPNKSPGQRKVLKGNITKRENELKILYEGGTVLNSLTGEKYNIEGWDKLGKYGKGEGQEIYRMARDSYRETFNLHQNLLLDKINNSSIPGGVNQPNTPKGKLIAQITRTFQEAMQLGIYFPLMRYGKYWLRVGKGKDGEFHMFENAIARNNYAELRAEQAGTTLAKQIAAQEYNVGDDLRDLRNEIVDSSKMLKDIFNMLETSSITDMEAIKDQVYQMYLMTLPERDIRRKFTHRQGKTGFSADVLRNFIVSQHTAANQLSRLAYADKIRLGIGSAYAELEGNPDKLKLSAFVDEIVMRASKEMTPTVAMGFDWDKVASIGNQAVFFYMLTAPKSALVQMTQLPLVTLPALTAKYGADALKTFARYSFLFNKLGTTKLDENGDVTTNWGEPSINDSKYINTHPDFEYRKALKRAWQTAQDRDIFMSTYAGDMTSRARVPTGEYQGFLNRGSRAAFNFMGGAFHHLERISREIAYMSTVELEIAKAKAEGLDITQATDRAIKAGTNMVYESLFNYSQYNKPRVMKSPFTRVATQFLSFPMQMTSYLVRNFYGMLPFLNKAEKKEAAIKFFGTIGMTWLFAGVVGLPGYSIILGLAEGIRDALRPDEDDEDADEYYDEDDDGNPLGKRSLDLWFREWFLPTYFGKDSSLAKALGLTDEQADMLQRGVKMGPISALTDLNIGASVSMDGLWFRDDNPDKDVKSAFNNFVLKTIGGPLGSMGEQVASAFDEFNNGYFNRGVEKLLPAFFRGPAKAVRLQEEGEQNRRGDVIRNAEWFTTGKLLATTLGFGSTEIAEIQKKHNLAKQIIAKIEKERSAILDNLDLMARRYDEDPTDKNEENLEAVLKKVSTYNYKNGMRPITGETINNSLSNRAENRGKGVEGLSVPTNMAPYIYPLVEKSSVNQP